MEEAQSWTRRVRSISISEISEKETVTLKDTHLEDAGLKSREYYQQRLNPVYAYFRELLLPLLDVELPFLTYIQSWHSPLLNFYFLHTANLGSHTFYVLMLPIPAWFGYLYILRDLVVVLGLGIYLTGFVKDAICLPRPASPPLKRLTLSTYTAREYGCPSSHTANATGVCLLFTYHLINNSSELYGVSFTTRVALVAIMIWYWLSLVIGRLYCGMHGLVDVSVGALIGAFVVVLRLVTCKYWDHLVMFNDSIFVPFYILFAFYFLIYIHPVPVDACPCFEDSVAFVGVIMGLDLGHYYIANSRFANPNSNYPSLIPFDYYELGLVSSILRVFVGVFAVLIWKSLAKPILLKCWLSPTNDKDNHHHHHKPEECYAFKARNDRDIWIKLVVYSGIPIVVTVFTKIMYPVLGLSVDH